MKAACAALLALLLAGCGGYTVRGRVVEGSMTLMTYVDGDDARLTERGVPNVEVIVYRDPDKPNRARVGRAVSGPDGDFAIPLDAFGAGFLVEQFEITAERNGFQPCRDTTPLPGSDSKLELLIMLAPGQGTLETTEDLMETYRKYR